ncbi:MAG: hypothetical protein R2839_03165 [Thermomicrobiales bacterium]
MAILDLAFLVLIFTPVVTVLRLGLVFRRLGTDALRSFRSSFFPFCWPVSSLRC